MRSHCLSINFTGILYICNGLQAQPNQEHSHSTQASPTNTLNHSKRPRARSADESNKNLLSPRDSKQSDENWVRMLH